MELAGRIEELWESETLEAEPIEAALAGLDRGEIRIAERRNGEWVVNEWAKKAILLYFRLRKVEPMDVGGLHFLDKIPVKTDYAERGVRVVPPGIARYGAFLSDGVVLMPGFVNIGAWVGPRTMVDTWATVGSCAQIGRNVHLSGGVGIGGVLEPPGAVPIVIGDDTMIGSRCIVAAGARVGNGVVLGAGCILTASIPVIDAETGDELSRGHVPDWCVAVSATRPRTFPGGDFGLPCVLVVKRLEEGERHDKSKLNEILRERGVST
jgi:2,3,4,5-tetrahydropyridine-2-carboxylate N-succinyltransferase